MWHKDQKSLCASVLANVKAVQYHGLSVSLSCALPASQLNRSPSLAWATSTIAAETSYRAQHS